MSKQAIEQKHKEIIESELFRIDGKPIDVPMAFIELCQLINGVDDEFIWYIGEDTDACLDDLLVGAYWAFTDWHGGQESDSYAALCAIGGIYSPNMASGPEQGTAAQDTYDMIDEWFKAKYSPKIGTKTYK